MLEVLVSPAVGGECSGSKPLPVSVFVKQTSNAVSARLVNAILFSPATSLGRPYSLPTASLICGQLLASALCPFCSCSGVRGRASSRPRVTRLYIHAYRPSAHRLLSH